MTEQATTTDELAFIRPYGEQEKQILTAEAVEFLTELVTHFTPQRNKLLAARIQQQQDIDNGTLPDFISETASIRDTDWKIRGIPADLQDRRVEITGPVERKMVINALNANVKVFMADFEDSLAPHSRYADFPAALIRDYTDLEILAETEEGDAYLFASKDKRIAFVTGHPEYDAQTLAQEYFRDVEAGLGPEVPYNYFPHNDPQNTPRASWRSHGNLLFTNWLNYYVYQITPYDLRHMNPTLD